MKFRTQYTTPVRIHSNVGSPIHTTYGGYYDDDGRIQLKEKGQENIYEFIQSHADSVDINVILSRYNNGDLSALSKTQGVFMDVTNFPGSYAEALNQINDMRDQFLHMPLEVRAEFNHSFTEFLAASDNVDFFDRINKYVKDPVVSTVVSGENEKSVVKEVVEGA